MRINELFKGDSDVEIIEKLGRYYFTVDDKNYCVSGLSGHIGFSMIEDDNGHSVYEPIKNNKNQFIVLNTVIACVEKIFQSNKYDFYYFCGDKKTGLNKLYSIMFNKLENRASQYNLTGFNTGDYFYDDWDGTWLEENKDTFFYFVNEQSFNGRIILDKAKEQDLPFVSQLEESRIDELFNGSNISVSDMNISQHGRSGFDFEIDGEHYRVEDQGGDLVFYNGEDSSPNYEPTKSNKNQYEVLGAVYDCFLKFLSNNKKVYHFSGSNSNGLAKLYSVIFKRLAKDAKKLGYISVDSGINNYNERTGKWWKRPMTNSHYWYFFPKEVFDDAGIRAECEELKMPIYENRIDELFKGDNIYEYQEISNGHFIFEDEYHGEYFLDIDYSFTGLSCSELNSYLNTESEDISWKEISYGKRNDKGNNPFSPTKSNNGVQFKVLSTVIKLITDYIKNNNDDETCYYFTGEIGNGLSKLYSRIFKNINTNGTSLVKKEIDFNDETLFCLIQKDLFNNVNESRIDELFTDESNIEIEKYKNMYYFNIDNNLYKVYTTNGEIIFANGNEKGEDRFIPSKNNKNQFLILNTVLKCIEQILSNKEIYYFSGDIENGLGKLYSTMFNKLKNKANSLGYVTMECGEYRFDEDSLFDEKYKPFIQKYGKEYFWFIPKEMMTKYVYDEAKKLDINVFGNNSNINESLYGSKKSSYEKDGKCKLILRHSKTIDEDKRNSRTRNIEKIFLETDEGERIKCPVNNLKGARAWAKYVNKTGIIEDQNTDRLFELVEDLIYMKETKKHLYKNRHSLSEDASNDIYNLSEGITTLNKLISRAARTGKIPEVDDIVFTTQISEIYSIEDETLIEKAKRAKHRQMSLLSPVIQSEEIEMTETPFTKYAKKWLSDNGQQTDDNSIDMLAKGLKEIVDDDVDYTIDFDPNNTESETVRKFADNLDCPVTSSYVATIAYKLDDGLELGTVEKQILRHILNGVDSEENLNEFAEPEREELPRKESPEIGDQVSTEYGPGSVVGKEGFTIEVELQNGSVISVNEFNVDVTYRPGEGQIEEMTILESFFNQF